MHKYQRSFILKIALLSAYVPLAYSATPIDLRHKPLSFSQSFIATATANSVNFSELKADIDFNNTKHTHFIQKYLGYPVWGSDYIVHQSARDSSLIKMNGKIYQNLASDLQNTPAYVFSPSQRDKIFAQAKQLYEKTMGEPFKTLRKNIKLLVYIDNQNKAHWAFLVTFIAQTQNSIAKPSYIMDAQSFEIYQEWNDAETSFATGGGWVGNKKIGKTMKYFYIQRDDLNNVCSMYSQAEIEQPNDIIIKYYAGFPNNQTPLQFDCVNKDEQYQVYWNGEFGAVNGAYSPANEALTSLINIQKMYHQWYKTPLLVDRHGKTIPFEVSVYMPYANAAMMILDAEDEADDLSVMLLGNGSDSTYPFTSMSVIAHEASHAFTMRHAGLIYNAQSGGLNEAFSDMAAQAYQYFSTGKNDWMMAAETPKESAALRYLDNPRRDCIGVPRGFECSIDHIADYTDTMNVHHSSGVFNKAFYLLSTSENWDTKKAFNVMVQANMRYWLPTTNFSEAACGVVDATIDYGYDLIAVTNAFKQVGIDINQCH